MTDIKQNNSIEVSPINSIEEHFYIIENIGSGTYGEVQKVKNKITGEIVALKKIKELKAEDGFPLSTIREVRLLQKLKHENVVRLISVYHCLADQSIYLCFEYCEYDLYALLFNKDTILKNEFKISIIMQLLIVLDYFSRINVLHRDLKPSNMFITKNNILKLGDFGLAREFSDHGIYSDKVITQWYRPPELLLGCRKYSHEVDIWSAGCIIFEILSNSNKPLFYCENNDMKQLDTIFKICGPPKIEFYPNTNNIELIEEFNKKYNNSQLDKYLEKYIPIEFKEFNQIILDMLSLNPKKRITPSKALQFNNYFLKKISNSNPYKLIPLKINEIHEKNIRELKKNL